VPAEHRSDPIRARYEIVSTALPRVLGDELTHSPELTRAAEQLRHVAESVPNAAGRPLYGGHAELPWPGTPHFQLWHVITLLREYRGDGHIAALRSNGLSGLDALITHTATGIGLDADFPRRSLGWRRDQWKAGTEHLTSRGFCAATASLTPAGMDQRSTVEDLTDELGYPPWRTPPAGRVDELVGLAKLIRQAVQASGLFPSGAFGPRYGQLR
jgi:hypothetical protein